MNRKLSMPCLVLAATTLLWGAAARADVIGPPPKTCPAGTEPGSCHGGPFCKPKVCVSDASCKAGQSCQSKKFCIKQINCGGGYGTKYIDVAKGTCPGGAPCKDGTCKTVKVCVAGTPPKPDAKPPVPDLKPPVPDSKQPAKDSKPPVPDSKQPAKDSKQPAKDGKQPAKDSKQPTTDSKATTPSDSDGCSCDVPAGGGSALLGLLLLAALSLVRRSRRG